MLRAVQAGFGDPLGATLLGDLKARGVQMVRLDLQRVPTAPMAYSLIDEAVRAGLRPLLIILETQAAWFESASATTSRFSTNPTSPAGGHPTMLRWCARWRTSSRGGIGSGRVRLELHCREAGLADERRRLAAAGGGPHRASVSEERRDVAGAAGRLLRPRGRDRRDRAIAGARSWGVSEFGYHTGPQKTGHLWWAKRWRWTDAQIADFVRQEWALWALAGASFACLYQLNDGLSGDPLDRYGIRYATGEWKPVADTFISD